MTAQGVCSFLSPSSVGLSVVGAAAQQLGIALPTRIYMLLARARGILSGPFLWARFPSLLANLLFWIYLMTCVSFRSHDFLIYQGIFLLSLFNTSVCARHPHVSESVELNTASALEAFPGWGLLNPPPRVERVDRKESRSLQVHGGEAPEQAGKTLWGVVHKFGFRGCKGILQEGTKWRGVCLFVFIHLLVLVPWGNTQVCTHPPQDSL